MNEATGIEVVPARSSAMEFVLAELRKDPMISFADVRDRAALHGLTIFPIVYGRAKGLLGLVPTAPRGQGKRARETAAKRESDWGGTEPPVEPMTEHQATVGSTVDLLRHVDDEGARRALDDPRERAPIDARPAPPPKSLRSTQRRQQPKAQAAHLAGDRIEELVGELLRIAEERDRYRAVLEAIRRELG